MSAAHEHVHGRHETAREATGRTLAQTSAAVIGVTLIAVGILGFIRGGSNFNTGTNVQGDDLIIFEVNGWHNLVHIASGVFLLLMAAKATTAALGPRAIRHDIRRRDGVGIH